MSRRAQLALGRRRFLGLILLLSALAIGRLAHATGGVVILTDSRVAQYREALTAAKSVLQDPPVLDVGAADLPQQLERAAPATVLAIGQKALQLAQASQPSVPVVFCMVLGSAAPASKSVTGVRLEVTPELQLSAWKRVHPGAKRIGVFYDPRTFGSYVAEAQKAAAALEVTLVAKPISDAKEVRAAIAGLGGSIDALWLLPDPQLITAEMFNFLLVFTLEHKIALFGFFDSFTRAGALASMAPDYAGIGRQAARLAADLAAKPAESRLPVPPPVWSPGVLSINVKTAQQFDLEVPADVQAKATQVYR